MTRKEALDISNLAGFMICSLRTYIKGRMGAEITSSSDDFPLLPPGLQRLVQEQEGYRGDILKACCAAIVE